MKSLHRGVMEKAAWEFDKELDRPPSQAGGLESMERLSKMVLVIQRTYLIPKRAPIFL